MKNNKSFVAYEDFTFGLWSAVAGLSATLILSLRRLVIREHEHFWINIDKKLDKRDKELRKDFDKRMKVIESNIHQIKTSETISNGSLFEIERLVRKVDERMGNEKR